MAQGTAAPPSCDRERSSSTFQARQARLADLGEVRFESERRRVDLSGCRGDKLDVQLEALVGDQCCEREAPVKVAVQAMVASVPRQTRDW